jgi:diguanylate cyclase (GGDEF)-like protein/PAS domain S-box-containing protein
MSRVRFYRIIVLPAVITALFVWLVDRAVDTLVPSQFLAGQLNMHKQHEFFLYPFIFVVFITYGFLARKRLRIPEELPATKSAAIETSMDGIAIYNRDNEFVFVNQAYASINGYDSPSEIIGNNVTIAYDEQERRRMELVVAPVLLKSGKWRGELLARRKNGSTYFQEASLTMLGDGGRVCIIRDITWRKRSEERIHRSEHFLNTIFHSIRDPFSIFDTEFRIVRVNEAYANLKSKRTDELIGKHCYAALQGRQTVCEGCVVAKTLHSSDPCAKDKRIVRENGTELWVEIYTYPILDGEGRVSHVIEYTRDITERRKSEDEKGRLIEKLERLSRTDGLTGLMNRRALTEHLNYELDRARRYRSDLSIILCDLDNFKQINDRYGHDTGDRALQLISTALEAIIRKTDIAGRYGGDEFMLILPDTGISGAESLADKILADLNVIDLPSHDDRPIRLSMSIGITCMTDPAESLHSLIKRADNAMYASKQAGRSRITTTSAASYP